ncbi:MAG: tetratricopeptide repeat protein [Humidesulfovibrio sp.]|uniref:tetratricopeptide repeat protein n=1 Tax=Humidesulfovibrio sp. TaxID=2910988 RepID=UPI0027FBA876|nr:tetratricopeptide repeat protein [Humidesulfovibrio sp.]MDQ7834147.1 tetratricopeptide repeat protein [Humidesulfovibrio sp.]
MRHINLATALALCACAMLHLSGCAGGTNGWLILTDADQRRAIERYRTALAKEPDDWMLQKRLGLAYFDLKDYALAEHSLERAQAINPGEPESLLYLGLSRIGKGERETGLDQLATFRWPFKFYHQQFVQEEANRLRKHPEEPSEQVIKDILEALKKGKREQWEMESDTPSGRRPNWY